MIHIDENDLLEQKLLLKRVSTRFFFHIFVFFKVVKKRGKMVNLKDLRREKNKERKGSQTLKNFSF